MSAAPSVLEAVSQAQAVPFDSEYVTLTKREHIELVMDARYWRSQHERAVSRQLQREASYKRFVFELREHAGQREVRLRAEMALAQAQAEHRETALRGELDFAQAKVRDLQQRLFGRKSERSKGASEQQPRSAGQPVRRGQRRGAPGHGRKMLAHLLKRIQTTRLDAPQCPACGEALNEFPGIEDSEVLEIEVKAYRRVIRRQRYRPSCQCVCMPGIVTAPAPCRLIERGKFGVSVWATVLLDKYLYGRPSHRLLQDLGQHGLAMAPGTLAGGLQTLAPLFEPLGGAAVP